MCNKSPNVSNNIGLMNNQKLTNFSPGSIRELSTISWPLMFSFLSMSIMSFFNRFFLSHYSVEAFEASVSAMNLAFLFQIPCMRITTIAQVFVARFAGSQELEKIGSVVWQMIWLSIFSLFFTLPLGLSIGTKVFQGTSIEKLAFPYFSYLMFANFLFPLAGALSAFFVGQGRTKTIGVIIAIVHILQICLDKILIFGIPKILLPLGALGAAISTITVQILYCFILFSLFLRKKELSIYETRKWQLHPQLLKQCIYLGVPRAIGKLFILTAWTGCVAILTQKGGDYLLVFSLGTSFYAFFSCLNEGLGQGIISIVSYYLGGKKLWYLPQIAKSSFVLLGGILFLLSFFFLFFPKSFIKTFFPHALTIEQLSILTYSCYGLWFFFLCDGLSWIGFGFLNGLKETRFYLFYTVLTVLFFNYLPIHFAYKSNHFGVETLWWIMSFPCLASSIAYFFRIVNKLKFLKTHHFLMKMD